MKGGNLGSLLQGEVVSHGELDGVVVPLSGLTFFLYHLGDSSLDCPHCALCEAVALRVVGSHDTMIHLQLVTQVVEGSQEFLATVCDYHGTRSILTDNVLEECECRDLTGLVDDGNCNHQVNLMLDCVEEVFVPSCCLHIGPTEVDSPGMKETCDWMRVELGGLRCERGTCSMAKVA